MNDEERVVGLPKPWLEGEEIGHLNQAFYATEPHAYFATRLVLLMVAAAKPEAINDALTEGLEYGTLKIGNDGVDEDAESEEEGEKRALAFVAGDATNLLQHVSETVLRYYMAHCPDLQGRFRPCPWLDLADEVNFAAFKRTVERRFADGASELTDRRRDDVTRTFYLGRNGGTDDPAELERLARSVDEIERWLRHFASYFLDDARLYNAMKHGLAVRPGKSMVELKTPADEERVARGERPLIHQDGPSIEYLGRTGPDEPFKRVTRWIRPDVAMAETKIGTWMIEQIWTVGRTRYVDLPAGAAKPMRLRFYDQVTLDKVMDAHLNENEFARLVIKTMEFPVGYMWAYEPNLRCTSCGRVPRENEERPRRRWRGIANRGKYIEPICPECLPKWKAAT